MIKTKTIKELKEILNKFMSHLLSITDGYLENKSTALKKKLRKAKKIKITCSIF